MKMPYDILVVDTIVMPYDILVGKYYRHACDIILRGEFPGTTSHLRLCFNRTIEMVDGISVIEVGPRLRGRLICRS